MSLPSKPWSASRIVAMQRRSVDMGVKAMRLTRHWQRKVKRADRLCDRWISLWCQLKQIDPHAPASLTDAGHGTRR